MLAAAVLALAGCERARAAPLEHTYESPEALARAVLTEIAHNDKDALEALALSEREFRERVWPELPASQPGRNLPMEYVWGDLRQKSVGHLHATLAEHGGRRYDLLRVEFLGETTAFRSFEVTRRAQLHVRDDRGRMHVVRLFGSVLRSGSEHKLFSYVVD
jgi:hypothetical protein